MFWQNTHLKVLIKIKIMIKKIDHIVITTSNIEKCLEFYESIGFKSKVSSERYEIFAGDFKINIHIEGKELSPHAQNVKVGSADICFEINGNIDAFKKNLENKLLIIELGIVERVGVNGSMKSIYLRDPDGNLIEFCSYV